MLPAGESCRQSLTPPRGNKKRCFLLRHSPWRPPVTINEKSLWISPEAFSFIGCLAVTYSRMGAPTLPSALTRFTSEFEMDSGGSTLPLPPSKFGSMLERLVAFFVSLICYMFIQSVLFFQLQYDLHGGRKCWNCLEQFQ